jgi:hypothetical protein
MLNILGTSEKIQLVTSVAGAIDVVGSYVKWDTASQTGKDPNGFGFLITTAATTDILVGVATDPLNLQFLSLKNTHATLSNTVTLQRVHTGPITVKLAPFPITLLAGEGAILNDAGTVFVYDLNGGVKSSSGIGVVDPRTNDFRLSGVSATPVMTADSTTLGTVYLAQYKGNRIALWDGLQWQLALPSAEPSLAVTGRTTDLPFDVFAFLNAGVVTLEFLNWTSATARATGLVRQDGVWVKSGQATRRYLGSIRPRSATTFAWVRAGTDAGGPRFDLFNADNRIEFNWRYSDTVNTHTYTLATWRQWNADVDAQIDIMVGLQEESLGALAFATSRNSTISIPRQVGIGFDSTTAPTSGCMMSATPNTVVSIDADQSARVVDFPAIGRHFYAMLQISTATGTCTWVGDDGATRLQSGMIGEWTC